jgi:hypothetical protein
MVLRSKVDDKMVTAKKMLRAVDILHVNDAVCSMRARHESFQILLQVLSNNQDQERSVGESKFWNKCEEEPKISVACVEWICSRAV